MHFKSYEEHLNEGYYSSYRSKKNETPSVPRKWKDGDVLMLIRGKKHKEDYGSTTHTNDGPGCIVEIESVNEKQTNSKRWVYKVHVKYGAVSHESKRKSSSGYGHTMQTVYSAYATFLVDEKHLSTDGVDEFLSIIKKSKLSNADGSRFRRISIPSGTPYYYTDGKEGRKTERELSEIPSYWAVDLTLLKKEPCICVENLSKYGGFLESSISPEEKVSIHVYEELAKAISEKLGLEAAIVKKKYGDEQVLQIKFLQVAPLILGGEKRGIILKNEEDFKSFRKDFVALLEKYVDPNAQRGLNIGANPFSEEVEKFKEDEEIPLGKILALAREIKVDLDAIKKKVRGMDLAEDIGL